MRRYENNIGMESFLFRGESCLLRNSTDNPYDENVRMIYIYLLLLSKLFKPMFHDRIPFFLLFDKK